MVDDCVTTLKDGVLVSMDYSEYRGIETHSAGVVHICTFAPGCLLSNVLQNTSAAFGMASHTKYGRRPRVVPEACMPECFEKRLKAILEPI
jgi:hypothetical protein